MPLLRNPFRSRPTDLVGDETYRPEGGPHPEESPNKADRWGSLAKPLTVRADSTSSEVRQPREYKMSEISDSGEFLPPSPTETKSSFWSTRSGASTRSSSHRSVLNDTEPFNISRESFDSYRRSFDISARSPVVDSTLQRPRQSLDAWRMRQPTAMSVSPISIPSEATAYTKRPSLNPYQPKLQSLPDSHINPPTAQPYESDSASSPDGSEDLSTTSTRTDNTTPSEPALDRFEDVGLGDAVVKKAVQQPTHVKKSSIFSRFGSTSTSSNDVNANSTDARPTSSGHSLGLSMFNRRRGHSGQGSELGSIPSTQQTPQAKKGSIPTSITTTES